VIIFIHGWQELSHSWRHQLASLSGLGFRVIAPDMRGYGHSSIYERHDDYALERIIDDMLMLVDSLQFEKALWVGQDWGAPVVWSIASHHPAQCHGVANLCVPYGTLELGLDDIIQYFDRETYLADKFPAGQWKYQRFYEENFERAIAPFDDNPYNAMKALFAKGSPNGAGKPTATAFVRHNNGWFRGANKAPDVPMDADVVTTQDLSIYAASLTRNGFFGPSSWYMNHAANADYARQAVNGGVINMPLLFLAGQYDYTCEVMVSRLAEPMRALCPMLTETVIQSGH
jgi:pimeloyl-ACP methyl ester carboxylesterase